MIECLALIASICINESAEIQVVYGAGWSGATISTSTSMITSEYAGDTINYASRNDMDKVCDRVCIIYSQQCAEELSSYRCVIYFSRDIHEPLRRLTIESKTPSLLASIKGSAKLCLDGRCFLLSELATTPRGAFPPFQRQRRPQ